MKHFTSIGSCLLLLACESSDNGGTGPPRPGFDDVPFPDFDPETPEWVCASASVSMNEVTPTVALLVDRSGSMRSSFGPTTRWGAVQDTLFDEDSGVVWRLHDEVRFGVALYNSEEGFEGGACPIIHDVAPALSNGQAIRNKFASVEPSQDTPTGASIHVAADMLVQVAEPDPKIILLATDGMPDTCEVPDPDGHDDAKTEAIIAAKAANEVGIDTFIVSVGPDIAEAHLQDMANAGVGRPLDTADDAPYYRALSPNTLVAAFDEIILGARFCTVPLELSVPLGDREGVRLVDGTVTLDGNPLVKGADWRLRDLDTVEIIGATCEALMAGGDHVVEAAFTCTRVIL